MSGSNRKTKIKSTIDSFGTFSLLNTVKSIFENPLHETNSGFTGYFPNKSKHQLKDGISNQKFSPSLKGSTL